jgi:hypothetical protein
VPNTGYYGRLVPVNLVQDSSQGCGRKWMPSLFFRPSPIALRERTGVPAMEGRSSLKTRGALGHKLINVVVIAVVYAVNVL